jgi:hypothetical protein
VRAFLARHANLLAFLPAAGTGASHGHTLVQHDVPVLTLLACALATACIVHQLAHHLLGRLAVTN